MAEDQGSWAMLEEAGLRPTEVRQRVLSSLLAAGSSLSHRELTDLLVGLDRVTIFRSIKLLKRAGLVHGVQGIDGTLRYVVNPREKRGCPGGHPHFFCVACGTMTCLADQVLPHVSVPLGAEVGGKQLLIYGRCPACASPRPTQVAPRSNSRGTK
jgi:Fe2+ or Zn2+ uptake regulation protein